MQTIPLLLIISIALFGLLHLIPGGSETVAFNPRMTQQARHDMIVALAILFGTLLGAVAGYFGGWVDNVIMRLTDVVLSFPLYLLLFVLSAFIAGASGLQNVVM